MRGGDESFWFSQPETNTAAKSAERAAAGPQTLGAYEGGSFIDSVDLSQ